MKKYLFTFFIIYLMASAGMAQNAKPDSIWEPFKYFIGNWNGKGGGEAGEGVYERSYNFIFNNRYIEIKNKSVYPPSDNYPGGEVHQDLGYISYDKIRGTFVLRQFHIEGFVNQYKLDTISADGKYIVFISEAIENIKSGWRAKETYNILSENEFTETFELAPPGGDFEVYTKVTLKK